jgi:large subunit ribosomal protein L19
MKNLHKFITMFEQPQMRSDLPQIKVGDEVQVDTWIIENERKRIQSFQGFVMCMRNRGLSSSFRVRRVVKGEGVERAFPLHGPMIHTIQIKKSQSVRQAKLYYMRDLFGKAARLKDK